MNRIRIIDVNNCLKGFKRMKKLSTLSAAVFLLSIASVCASVTNINAFVCEELLIPNSVRALSNVK